jgi:hypothetical protein
MESSDSKRVPGSDVHSGWPRPNYNFSQYSGHVRNDYKDMSSYIHRLESFESYPVRPYHPRPSELAALGFYYLGLSDNVKCFCCNLILCNWEIHDCAMREHYKHSLGTCAYVNHINNFRQ